MHGHIPAKAKTPSMLVDSCLCHLVLDMVLDAEAQFYRRVYRGLWQAIKYMVWSKLLVRRSSRMSSTMLIIMQESWQRLWTQRQWLQTLLVSSSSI